MSSGMGSDQGNDDAPAVAAEPDGGAPDSSRASGTDPAGGSSAGESFITRGRRQYLIAEKPGPRPRGVAPVDLGVIEQACKDDPAIEFKRTIKPRHIIGAVATRGLSRPQSILVAEMPRSRAEALRENPQLIVEQDHALTYAPAVPTGTLRDPGVLVPSAAQLDVTVTVVSKAGAPVAGATVYLFGTWPAQGITDAQGHVVLTLMDQSLAAVQGCYINPKDGYWSLWVPRPVLDPTRNNVVALTPLAETIAEFPDRQVMGWGHKAMKLDQLPTHYTGAGVKVAVIDSGATTTHPDLMGQVKAGFDVLAQNDVTWNVDAIAHGSHCAGVIAAADTGTGVRGFAPGVELHVCKIFPDGRFSHLIEALDYCIENQIDIANLSLGTDETSELVNQKIEQAKQAGVACIVAAGNTSGPVRYPASSPNVLAVAAVGKEGEYPSDSYHATQIFEGDGVGKSNGYYSARFTCFGPEIGVCAPGVAVLSSVPDTGYAAWDGTSMAAPHVVGLAALILAHHDDFKGAYRTRNARRVDRLFEIIKASCQPLDLGDRNRTGAGMPDAVAAFRSETSSSGPAGEAGATVDRPQAGSSLEQLRALMQRAGLLPGGEPEPSTSESADGEPADGNGRGAEPVMTLDQLTELMEHAGLTQ